MVHPFLFLQWLEEQLNLHIGEHVMYTWLVMLLLIGVALLVKRSIRTVPGGCRTSSNRSLPGSRG
jgi:F-type H+-transporting ATPase subunit a